MIEKTLIVAKPDAVQRGLVGEIIKRFECRGFRIAGLKMVVPSMELVGNHYADDRNWKIETGSRTKEIMQSKGFVMSESPEQIGDRIRCWNMAGIQGKPVVAIVFEGFHAVEMGRKIVGGTEPRGALPGTIRGDFTVDSYMVADSKKRVIKNLVHASGSVSEAVREIKLWFNDDELFDYPFKQWDLIHGD